MVQEKFKSSFLHDQHGIAQIKNSRDGYNIIQVNRPGDVEHMSDIKMNIYRKDEV